MPITEGIAAAKLATDVAKVALDLLRNPKPDTEAVRTRLIELQDLILSAKFALGEAEEENRQLRRQLDDRETFKALQSDMEFIQDGAFYLRKSEQAQGIFNPLCPVCWGDNNKTIPLTPMASGYYSCAKHDIRYATAEARKALQARRDQEQADASSFAILPGSKLFGR